MNIRGWLVRLYPLHWRQRYGEEFEALLEQCLNGPMDVLDIILGALDAHLWSSAAGTWRLMNMNNKLRTAILLVFAAYIAFIVAGMGVYGFADDSPFIPMMKTNLALYVAWTTIQLGSVVALAAVVVGGAPLAWTIVRRAFTSHRRDLRILLVPVYSFLALVLYFLAMVYISFHTTILSPPSSALGRALLGGLVAIFILGAVASTFAVWKVLASTDIALGSLPLLGESRPVRLYEFALVPAIIATLAMAAMFLASIAWFWIAFSARPDVLAGNGGPMLTNSKAALCVILLLMFAGVAAAIFGLARLRGARTSPAL
jgi:hypothetical protein